MKFNDNFLDLLKSRTSIVSVIQETVSLKKNGKDFWGCCPFHKEKTPSFSVKEDRGSFYCFGCHAHGDVITFFQKTHNLSFAKAVEALACRIGLSIPLQQTSASKNDEWLYSIMEWAAQWFQRQLLSGGGEKARDYLYSRNILPAEIEKFRLGWAPAGSGLIKFLKHKGFSHGQISESGLMSPEKNMVFFWDRIMFPIIDFKNRVLAFGGRRLDQGMPKYLNSLENKNFLKKQTLYGFSKEFYSQKGPLFLVEGYLDVIATQRKFQALAPLGTAVSPEQVKIFLKYSRDIVLCFDGDGPGKKATTKTALCFLTLITPEHKIRIIHTPEGQDPHHICTKNPEMMESLLEKAQPLSQKIWQTILEEHQESTPEARALRTRTIQKILQSMKNQELEMFYRSFLFEKQKEWIKQQFFLKNTENKKFKTGRFWNSQSYKPSGRTFVNHEKNHKNHFNFKVDPSDHQPPPSIQPNTLSKMLLSLVLHHPFILENALESFAALIFEPGSMEEEIQKILLEWCETCPFYTLDSPFSAGNVGSKESRQEDLQNTKVIFSSKSQALHSRLKDFFVENGKEALWKKNFQAHFLGEQEKMLSQEAALEEWKNIFEVHQIERWNSVEIENIKKNLSKSNKEQFNNAKQTPNALEQDQSAQYSWERIKKLKESYLEKIYGMQ